MLKKQTIFCLLNAFLNIPLLSQELLEPTPARLLTSFSFRQFSGGVILLKAAINNYPDSLNFILDTGSGGISLDSTTCCYLNLPITPSDITIRGIGGVRRVNFTNNNTLHLPGLRIDSLNFHINDYELLTSVYGEHIDGIIGYSFFSRYIVMINYDSNRIQVYTPGYIKYPRGGYLLKPTGRNIPIQQAYVKETSSISAKFYFDIGAGICLLFSSDFAKDSLHFNTKKKVFLTQAEGIGGKAQMKITTLKEFRLGSYKFKKIPVYIFEDHHNITDYPQLGGLIGNDLLHRFNIIINYLQKDIHLIPNTHFREPFDYSYTGLAFYHINGAVRITDIMKNSPAEKAGLQPGDIIIGMDNAFGKDIQIYKTFLMQTGKKIKILIMRDKQPMEVILKVESIF